MHGADVNSEKQRQPINSPRKTNAMHLWCLKKKEKERKGRKGGEKEKEGMEGGREEEVANLVLGRWLSC